MSYTPNRYSRLSHDEFIQVLRACAANTMNMQLQDMVLECAARLDRVVPPLRHPDDQDPEIGPN